MITTKRSVDFNSSVYERDVSSVGLITRNPSTYKEFVEDKSHEENMEQAKLRMQRNLDKIMNYDKYASEEKQSSIDVIVKTNIDEIVKDSAAANPDEDIRPTSTTMQFGDGQAEQIFNEMNSREEVAGEYKLNKKGKFVVALYTLAVTVILALIVLNTGVLAVLTDRNAMHSALLAERVSDYSSLSQEIAEKSSLDYVSNIAENEFGMINN